jgi:hypothetical protein
MSSFGKFCAVKWAVDNFDKTVDKSIMSTDAVVDLHG